MRSGIGFEMDLKVLFNSFALLPPLASFPARGEGGRSAQTKVEWGEGEGATAD